MTIIAGTIIPIGSPVIVAAANTFGLPVIPLAVVATVGFTIGITINYYVAYFLGRPYVIKKVSRQIGRSNEAVEQMGYRPKTM